jgi:hypothetical protein
MKKLLTLIALCGVFFLSYGQTLAENESISTDALPDFSPIPKIVRQIFKDTCESDFMATDSFTLERRKDLAFLETDRFYQNGLLMLHLTLIFNKYEPDRFICLIKYKRDSTIKSITKYYWFKDVHVHKIFILSDEQRKFIESFKAPDDPTAVLAYFNLLKIWKL